MRGAPLPSLIIALLEVGPVLLCFRELARMKAVCFRIDAAESSKMTGALEESSAW